MTVSPDALRAALENSLAENPDDLATHMAYADLLVDQGDPRGEFIQVQLALEDPQRTPKERKRLRAREQQLLEQHQREWIGEAADVFFPADDEALEEINERLGIEVYGTDFFSFRFARGWLDRLILDDLSGTFAEILGRSPTLLLLRDLTILHSNYSTGYEGLAQWPALACLRRFQVGSENDTCQISAKTVEKAIAQMPRLEELYLYAHGVATNDIFKLPLPFLRKLHVHHIREYPLAVLGKNPTMSNLVELSCWPHSLDDDQAYIQPGPFRKLCFSPHLKSLTHLALYLTDIGDEGVEALIESGLLRRLRVLDLWSGRITDRGARLLAASPDIRHLERLRLAQNNLTAEGIRLLRTTGVNLEAENQLTDALIAQNAHLTDGDIE